MNRSTINVTKPESLERINLTNDRNIAASPTLSVIHSNIHTMPQVTEVKSKGFLVKVRSIVISERPAKPSTLSDTGYTWVG